jgi:hypothetical protein
VGKAGLTSPLGFASELKDAFTTAFWIKTKSRPFMGGLFSANAHSGLSLDLVQGNLRLSSFRTWGIGGSNPSSMLSSWTHFAVVYDVENLKLYRNGNLVMTVPSEGRSINWGKELRLGVGDLEAAYADLCFYNRAFNAEDVEALYLWGKHIAASPASASLPVATALPPR